MITIFKGNIAHYDNVMLGIKEVSMINVLCQKKCRSQKSHSKLCTTTVQVEFNVFCCGIFPENGDETMEVVGENQPVTKTKKKLKKATKSGSGKNVKRLKKKRKNKYKW